MSGVWMASRLTEQNARWQHACQQSWAVWARWARAGRHRPADA
jgi:hypothetical protein